MTALRLLIQVLHRWGNLSSIVLSAPAPIDDLCLLALQVPPIALTLTLPLPLPLTLPLTLTLTGAGGAAPR